MDEKKLVETCNENTPVCIPFFAHENVIMHKDADNERAYKECERMHRTIRFICATFLIFVILIIGILVSNYTIRTRNWLSTLDQLMSRYAVTEVVDGGNVYQQPD